MKLRTAIYLGLFLSPFVSGEGASHDPLLVWMDQIAQRQIQLREKAIARIHTVADAGTPETISAQDNPG